MKTIGIFLLSSFFVVLIIWFFIYFFIVYGKEDGKPKKDSDEQRFYDSLGLYPDKEFRFTTTNKWIYSINIFNSSRKIVIVNLTKRNVIDLDYQNIVQCIVQQDNSTIMESSAGNAMAGAILAGTTGAIIGAASHSTKDVCSELSVHIITNDVLNPGIVIPLINNRISRNTPEYQFLLDQANAIYATFTVIIHENNQMQSMNLYLGNRIQSNRNLGPAKNANNFPDQSLNGSSVSQPYYPPASAQNPPINNNYYDPNGPQYPN